MRIIRLQAEGFKRLIAVDITPEGDLVQLRGNNGNGKSSVLDSIFAALGGAGAAPEKPVRDGEEAAVIRLDLGELIVTRYFTAAGTTGLKVTTPDGASYNSAQTMLDKLVGHISFDPLAFRDLKPEEQAAELRKVVDIVDPETGEPIDLDAIDKFIDDTMKARRDVNRDGKAVAARFEGMGGIRHVPEDAPSRDDIVAKMAGASEHNSGIEREKARREQMVAEVHECDRRANDLLAQAKAWRNQAEQAEAAAKTHVEKGSEVAEEHNRLTAESPIAEPIDVSELSKSLAEVDNIEANRRHNDERERLRKEYEAIAATSKAMGDKMKAAHKRRVEAIAAATMPVAGLSLGMEEDKLVVLFNGIPFSQASDADRLRVSCGVAMAANPKLRVLRVKDASLLDKQSVELLRQMAKDNDFQVFAEHVGDEGPGIIMEEGRVRGAPDPEPLEKPKIRKPKQEGAASEIPEIAEPIAPEPATDAKAEPASAPKAKALRSFSTKPRTGDMFGD